MAHLHSTGATCLMAGSMWPHGREQVQGGEKLAGTGQLCANSNSSIRKHQLSFLSSPHFSYLSFYELFFQLSRCWAFGEHIFQRSALIAEALGSLSEAI